MVGSRAIGLGMKGGLLVALFVFAVHRPALAAELADGAEIAAFLNDSEIVGVDTNWKQTFAADGKTSYFAGGSRPSRGGWDVRGDQYCSVWPPSEDWVCYDVVLSEQDGKEIITWIDAAGESTIGAKTLP